MPTLDGPLAVVGGEGCIAVVEDVVRAVGEDDVALLAAGRADQCRDDLGPGDPGEWEPLVEGDGGDGIEVVIVIVFVFVFVFVATIMFAPVALLLMIVSLRPLTFMVVSGDERQRWLLLATPAA